MHLQECTGCWGVEETWELGVVISDWVIFSIIAATLVIASMVALLFIPAGIIRFAPKSLWTWFNANKIRRNILTFVTTVYVFCMFPVIFLTLMATNQEVGPVPKKPFQVFIQDNNNQAPLASVERVQALAKDLSKFESMTIGETQKLIRELPIAIDNATGEVQSQMDENQTLKNELASEKDRIDELVRINTELKSVTTGQIEAIKVLLTEDANKTGQKYFFYGVIASVFLAVIFGLFNPWLEFFRAKLVYMLSSKRNKK